MPVAQTSVQLVYRHLRQLTTRHSEVPDHQLVQRFVACRDETAFAALVDRHAAMVLGVCRSILHNRHDAEDIFQAAFLVLARKAASIRRGASVGSWLYAVASRLAQKARVRAGKRRVHELQAPSLPGPALMDELTWGELRGILHEEVSRLPEKYRAAVVLCYWEGMTHEQAAKQLGCAKCTIKDRLERAREMLRTRLARRGLALSAAWFAVSLSGGTSSVAAPAALVQATVRGAMLFSMGQPVAGLVSAQAAGFARRTLQGMFLGKLQCALALTLMIGVLSGGAVLALLQKPVAPEAPAASTSPTPKKEPARRDGLEDPLPAGAVARLGTLRFRHADSINRIAVGTDGASVLSAAGSAVYVWDLATGKERRRFPHETPVTSFAVSRDGKLLAAGCEDGTIHLWGAATGRELRHFTAHKGRAPDWRGPSGAFVGGYNGNGFTADGRHIVSMGSDNTIRLWDAASGEQVREFGRFSEVGGLSLAPDGKTLVGVVKNDNMWELRLWEVATGKERKRQPQPGKQILMPTFSPDGKRLAMAVGEMDWKQPCDIQLWDAGAENVIRTLRGHKSWAWCAFAPDGRTLVSSGTDNTARLWDVATGKEIGRVGGEGKLFMNQLLFCPDGRTLVSYTQGEHRLRFWDHAGGKEIRPSEDAFSPVEFLSFSPDGRWLAAGSKSDWATRLWDVADRKRVRRLEHGLLMGLQFSPDGSQLASATWTDGQVRIWEAASGKELRRIPSDKAANAVHCLAWSGDGKVLATWNLNDRLIRLWDAETGKPLRTLSAGVDQIEALVFSPDSTVLAALGGERESPDRTLILRWAVDSGGPLPQLEASMGSVNVAYYAHPRLAFAPDGRTLAVGGRGAEASIYLWEMVSGRLRGMLKFGEDITSLSFSPDGKLLAAANNTNARHLTIQKPGKSQPSRVHLWDLAAEKELPPLEGHQGSIASLAFSPDGKLLATGGNDTTILLWDATRLKARPPEAAPLKPEQLESLWADLAGQDAAKAYRAIRTLASSPQVSVGFLKRRLRPVAPADAKQVARLLADLESEQFAVREKATRELEKLGETAAADLRKALAGKPSLEVKRRIEQLLEKADGLDHVRTVRAVEALERIGTPEARELCAALARGAAGARLTREAQGTLRRIAR
jgi:RNA polymerase sigma factor (sigma-70 family)